MKVVYGIVSSFRARVPRIEYRLCSVFTVLLMFVLLIIDQARARHIVELCVTFSMQCKRHKSTIVVAKDPQSHVGSLITSISE